jgi:hypothetical protein
MYGITVCRAKLPFVHTAPWGTPTERVQRLPPRLHPDVRRQPNGLANGAAGAHIPKMEKYRSRMLEVIVTNRPPKWEWEVSSGGEMIASGFESEQIAARFEGYNAMFLLLAGGWNP